MDPEMLQAALVGYEHQLSEIQAKIAEIRSRLGGRAETAPNRTAPVRRNLSVEARHRIAAAQKKRWKAFQKAKEEAARMAAAPVRKPAKKRAARRRAAAASAGRAAKPAGAVSKPAAQVAAAQAPGNQPS
jgi:hypothetical protein